MKEYKMIKCSRREAEGIMNDMAERGFAAHWKYKE